MAFLVWVLWKNTYEPLSLNSQTEELKKEEFNFKFVMDLALAKLPVHPLELFTHFLLWERIRRKPKQAQTLKGTKKIFITRNYKKREVGNGGEGVRTKCYCQPWMFLIFISIQTALEGVRVQYQRIMADINV